MSRLNVLVALNAFSDQSPSNSNSLNNFKWTRELACLEGESPKSDAFTVTPGQPVAYYSGLRTLGQDNTTEYTVSLKSGSTYTLANTAGTVPTIALARATTQDITSQFQVTKNGPLAIFTRIAGTSLGGAVIQPGDIVEIYSNFSPLNQGLFTVLAASADSFTVENANATLETVTLSSAASLEFYSLNNVQKDDVLTISSGFGLPILGSYIITKVKPGKVEFYSPNPLPTSTALSQVTIAKSSKQFIYLETSTAIKVTINGNDPVVVQPFITASGNKPGLLMLKSTIHSISLECDTIQSSEVFIATIE